MIFWSNLVRSPAINLGIDRSNSVLFRHTTKYQEENKMGERSTEFNQQSIAFERLNSIITLVGHTPIYKSVQNPPPTYLWPGPQCQIIKLWS